MKGTRDDGEVFYRGSLTRATPYYLMETFMPEVSRKMNPKCYSWQLLRPVKLLISIEGEIKNMLIKIP